MRFGILLALALLGSAGAARAEEKFGELNPQELGVDYYRGKSGDAKIDPHLCAYGVFMDKTGQHEEARKIFERCANEGNLQAMPWMSYTEENGFDRASNPIAAAEWDKKLADKGSSLGQFNYGLDLLRGHGVTQDRALGKDFVDRAVKGGDATARELAAHDYDPESVTPSADYARYRKPQF